MRRLVVNADDLGYDPEIDRGILEAHARGIVTSATAMVGTRWSAAALRAAPPALGVGLHVVLDEGLSPAAAGEAIRVQLDRFEQLRGAPPSHLDAHRHAHARPGMLPVFAAAAAARGLPLRAIDGAMRRELRAAGVRTSGAFLGDAALRPCWTRERLLAALAALPEGTAELMAHPGHAPSHARTSFGIEREVELEALCDPEARRALAALGVQLVTWTAI